ncbi:MAG: hypothetical protein ACE5G0_16620, partial [Rhodothermales bacterium]
MHRSILLRLPFLTACILFLLPLTVVAQEARPISPDMITPPGAPDVRSVNISLGDDPAGKTQVDCGFGQVFVGTVFDPINFTLQNLPSSTQDLTGVAAQITASNHFTLSNFATTQGNILTSNSQGAQVDIGTLVPGQSETVSFRMEAIQPGQGVLTLHGFHSGGDFPNSPTDCDITVELLPITITGLKWDDQNGNGLQEPGEPGVEGVTIFNDENGNGAHDPGELSTTTGNDGSYELVDQPTQITQHYIIREVLPQGLLQTFPPGNGFYEADLDHGTTVRNADFGNQTPGNFIETDAYEQTTGLVQLQGGVFGDRPQTALLQGPVSIRVNMDGPNEGDALDDDQNNLDEVQTEIIAMDLRGSIGGIEVKLRTNPDQKSLGQIEELVNNTQGVLDLHPFAPGEAESFFDVFFEIEVGDGLFLRNQEPLFVQATIGEKPPFDRYIHLIPPGGPIQLFDRNGQPSGIFLTRAEHYTGIVEIDEFTSTTAIVQLQGGPIGDEPREVVLRGPATVAVCFPGPVEGDAVDRDDNGRDQVETELVSMDLSGNLAGLPIRLRQSPAHPSKGEIEENNNNTDGTLDLDPFAPGDADSFFDVFFEIEIGDDLVLHNAEPLFIQATIRHKPPFDRYFHLIPPGGPIELLDANNNPTGVFIVQAEHNTGFVEIDRLPTTTALVQLAGGPFGDIPQPFILSGPALIHVFFEGAEGEAQDDDGNGLEEVQTELVSMNLTDGNIILQENPDEPSLGAIEEKANNTNGILDLDPFAPGDANSFFDVFFEIDAGGGLLLRNKVALRIEAMISEKPPHDRYIHLIPPGGAIELFDRNGNPTGIFIVRAEHNTGFVEQDQFPASLAEVELIHPDRTTEPLRLLGPTLVLVFFEDNNEGDADDDDNNGLDEVETEMVSLSLKGTSSLGPIEVRLRRDEPSTGFIEEEENNTKDRLDIDPFHDGDATSCFDVFFEIIVGGVVMHTERPKRMCTTITEKPPGPGDVYFNPDEIPLLDENGNPTGFSIGITRHTPNRDGKPPSAPQIIMPENGAQIVVGGSTRDNALPPSTLFEATWTESTDPDGDEVNYTWELSTSNAFAPSSVVLSGNVGTATRFETDFGTLAGVLEGQGINLNEPLTLFHRAVAFDGIDGSTPGPPSQVTLIRGTLVATDDETAIPDRVTLAQNFPNPFKPTTRIQFALPESDAVRLVVYDLLGREVAVLVDARMFAGRHEVVFNAGDLPSG